jgi:hypothetical protein
MLSDALIDNAIIVRDGFMPGAAGKMEESAKWIFLKP